MQDITRIFDILDKQKNSLPLENALNAKVNGEWKPTSSFEFWVRASRVSYALWALGLQKDDKVAIISNNRPEWNILDMGMLQAGIINVPLYTTLSAQETQFILNDCGAKLIFVSDALLYEKVKSIRSQLSEVKDIISFEKIEGVTFWGDFILKGELNQKDKQLEEVKKSILPDDIATLIYTSGTTGNPKGVMLTHNNLVSNVWGTRTLMPAGYKAKALSFLPLCHVYERMLTYVYMYCGISIYYAQSMETIVDNMKEVKPDAFSAVPRLLEKVYDKIVAKGKELKGVKRALFFWALDLGLKYELDGANGLYYEMQLWLANKLIFNKWREALGGNVKAIVSGGAALQPRLARVFWAAKIVVLEGYGLTETSPVIAVNNTNRKNAVRIGTVGPVIEGVEVKIAEDGEILCKGPNVMKGYYKRPDLTAEVIDADGFFHTGDIGVMENGRFLKITDRKKEIFKTSGGKYIAPQALENKFKESPFIEQMMVVGENMKFASALIVPSFAHLKSWCEIKSIPYESNESVIRNPDVIARIQSEVNGFNENFGQTEQIKKFILLPVEWTPNSGDLTQKLSLKRKVIAERNKDAIEKMYGE
ncbi:MAG: long-chain fatty acid--CoA ligase [Bacteroidetes bacterium]|nr:long-chain fatty acid--CoA ligase [Bacteroidota bacterium]